jgi:predicted nucleic acid-binding protein
MKPRFVDTNIILRHLLNDDPAQSPASFALIQSIEQGAILAWTSHLVIAEVVFVLANKKIFGLSRDEIRDRLLPIINLPNLKIAQKRLFTRIFSLYTCLPIDYIDCYHAALLESLQDVDLYSYDAHFDLIEGLRRIEP